MTSLYFHVNGTPGAQGSKRHVGRGILVESSAKVKPWRSDVKAAAEHALKAAGYADELPAFDGPVEARITFRFPRPRSHYRTGRNAHLLKDGAPSYPTGRNLGDIDKLLRSTYDALTASGAIADDSLIVREQTAKVWCEPGQAPGASIRLHLLEATIAGLQDSA